MISKREISGWWDRVCTRTGWSDKISKRKWMILQIVFSALIMLAFSFLFGHLLDGESWKDFFRVGLLTAVFVAVFGHGDWNRDQQKIREKENEETVTL